MPIYEYECQKCGHEFEREQRIVDDPIKTCPSCKARKAKRLISTTSFVLKGGGWYKDLYSSTSGKGDSKDESKSSSSSSDGSSKSSSSSSDGSSKSSSSSGDSKKKKKSSAAA